jgi:hypothetical protein
MLLLLSGCLYISNAEHYARLEELAGDSGGAHHGSVAIDSLTPAFGTDAGGTSVTLEGGPFTSGTTVEVDGVEGVVESFTEDSLVFTTPAGSGEGPVTVAVTTANGAGSLDDAYTYWEDATGGIGAYGEFAWYQPVGGYWAETWYSRADVGFVHPAASWDYYKYWGPALDECLHIDASGNQDYTYDPGLDKYDARRGTLTLSELSATSLDLAWNADDSLFENQDVQHDAYIPGGVYKAILNDSPAVPDMTVAGVFYLPEEFTVTSPQIDVPTLPELTKYFSFRWSGGSRADAVLLQMGIMNGSGTTFQEQVYCAVTDDGSFDVPSSLWTSWVAGRTVNVLVGRYKMGDGLLPTNNGRVATVGEYWIYGAGTSQ